MTVLHFRDKKEKRKKIVMITCYDYTSAKLVADTQVDCILVGDSVAMTMHGFPNTLAATVDLIALHTAAVSRGAGNKFIISDLPFLSYRKSLSKTVSAAETLIRAGAHAIKLEGAEGNLNSIRHLVESGVPVMGHLGLTPQAVNTLGGYRVQGRSEADASRMLECAIALQEAGCFAVVLECVPSVLAQHITQQLDIPTIGIGAGPHTNGQVLVFQDLLGLNTDFAPKFIKTFINGGELIKQGIDAYAAATHAEDFPSHEHCF